MKKIIPIFILIFAIYFGSLELLRLNPSIKINNKLQCFPVSDYQEKEGIKVLSIESCEPYEAGYFHGEKLKKEIGEMKNFLKNDMLLGGKDKYFGYLAYSILQNKAKKFVKYIPQPYLEEMQGIADGAGVNFNDILLINTYDDMLQIAGCASMIIPVKANFNENFIHTRNLDYPIKILAKEKVVLKYKSHISIGFPGYIGVLTGIGKKGISLSTHTAYSKNHGEYGIPSGFLYRNIIQESSNIHEVENTLINSKRTIANNLMIGSYIENTGIVFEFDAKNLDSRSIDNKNIIVSTNHFRTAKMVKVATNGEGKRYSQFFNKIEKLGQISIDGIKDIMSDYKDTKYWDTIANNGTIQSVIMIPKLKKIFIANGKDIPVTKGKYIEIGF